MLLKMRNITKEFPGVRALVDVDYSLKTGEVHALVGENGAGKSTLIKILSGVHRPDRGQIILNDEVVSFSKPSDAIQAGISVIYQEFNLVEYLSVAENIYIGNEGRNWWNLGKRSLIRRGQTLLDSLGFDIDASKRVRELNVSQKQMVEIAKALATNARIIVMDEPTATLTEHETKTLFKHIDNLKERDVSVIFISHRLEEVFEIADSVTVLRDGVRISSGRISEYTHGKLIGDVVGRAIEDMFPKANVPGEEIAFEVEDLSIPGVVERVSLSVRKNEIFGIAGLVGSGKGEIGQGIYGGMKAFCRRATLFGKEYRLPTRPEYALEKGVLLVPEDRKNMGLVLMLNVMQNVILPNTELVAKFARFNWREAKRISRGMVDRLGVKTPSLKQKVMHLSGGNQQKVVLAKGLLKEPRLVIFVEPTRGIDVGAKVEVYKIMSELAERGIGIIMISSELPEIVSISDRVLVMHRGKQTALLEGSDIAQERIMEAAMGG
ncbi:MAG TPA: D-xylose ABC transporter ATP-binding protein [Kosmotogaceae bacterium]|nr:MAG: ABC transporter related [Thermotogales bacterium 46_20]HAA84998.1 D-xylose ABC transporter ATP-binding protein [Kosmotogaceae bacterium]